MTTRNFYGIREKKPRRFETPDGRNHLIGTRMETRPGIVKDNTTAQGNPVTHIGHLKSDDCNALFKLAITDEGKLISDGFNCYPAIPQANNVLGYWKLEDYAGAGKIIDETSNHNDGTNYGALYRQTGQVCKCMSFDGSSQYIEIPDVVDNTNSFSVSMWFYANDLMDRIILGDDTNIDGKRFNFHLGIHVAEELMWHFEPDGATNYNINTPILIETWYHAVATINKTTSEMKGYLNGSLIDTVSITFPSSDPGVVWAIGAGPTNNLYFNGLIDEVIIWNTVLTPAEILDYYNRTK